MVVWLSRFGRAAARRVQPLNDLSVVMRFMLALYAARGADIKS